MSNNTELTDQEKIKALESEIKVMREALNRVETIIGITPDYVHEQIVKPIKFE